MPYIVTNSDGTITTTVSDLTVDTTTFSAALIGRGVSNFGQFFVQNQIRQLENYASIVPPSPSVRLIGQLWYDKTERVFRVWDGDIWKRATNIVVGSAQQRPVSALAGGGAAFWNTTISKLEIHSGTRFREASYAGEVTNEYSSNNLVSNPTFYGTRVRNLFLLDEDGLPQPVLALSYVKSTTAPSANRGSTQIGEQYETIMAIFSDTEFTVGSNTETPVENLIVNFTPELIETGGIAQGRQGRPIGKILKGINLRAEYEEDAIIVAKEIYANYAQIQNLDIDDITVTGSAIFNNINITNNAFVGGKLTVDGDIETLSTLYANSAVITTNLDVGGNINLTGGGVLNGASTQLVVTETANNQPHYLMFVDSTATGAKSAYTDSGVQYNPSSNVMTVSGNVVGNYFVGIATQAQYADLAEIYSTDIEYEPGTLVKIGGEKELTQTTFEFDQEVFGVISTQPAHVMNSLAEGQAIALTGRVPVRVIGPVNKGERIVSSPVPGVGWALRKNDIYDTRTVIGRSLETKTDTAEALIEVVVGVK